MLINIIEILKKTVDNSTRVMISIAIRANISWVLEFTKVIVARNIIARKRMLSAIDAIGRARGGAFFVW